LRPISSSFGLPLFTGVADRFKCKMMRTVFSATILSSALLRAATAEEKVFGYTGSDQDWQVPESVSSVTVKIWGGGGGGGESNQNIGGGRGDHDSGGGGGGFTIGTLK
jgi:hypothetical protein